MSSFRLAMPMKPNLQNLRGRLAVLSLLLLVPTGCGPGADDATAKNLVSPSSDESKQERRDPIPVIVTTVKQGAATSWIMASGNLEAVEIVDVLAKVPGQVQRLAVEEGSTVEAGSVLLELDPNEYRIAAERAQAEVDKKVADLSRYERMLREGVLSQVDYDQARYDQRQSELALEQARIDLHEAIVRAPISGVISSRLVHRGARVSAYQHLFTIVDPNRLWVHVRVPEADLPGLGQGQPSTITSDVLAEQEFIGRVERISPVVDPQSGTAKATIRIEDPRRNLMPGMFVNVRITTDSRADALLLPSSGALYERARAEPAWALAFEDPIAAVFVASHPALAAPVRLDTLPEAVDFPGL